MRKWARAWPTRADLSFIEDNVTRACIYIFVKNMSGAHTMVSYGKFLMKALKATTPRTAVAT